MISPEVVQMFHASQVSKDAMAVLTAGRLVPQTEASLARDYLLIILTISNAVRAGGLRHMTLEELQTGTAEEGSGDLVVHVSIPFIDLYAKGYEQLSSICK